MTDASDYGITHPDPAVKLLLLDLDGTARRCTVPGQPCPNKRGQQELYPGTADLLNAYIAAGTKVAFVTNQGDVGLGCMTADDFNDTMDELKDLLGWSELDVYACTHRPDHGCACRKPGPRMLLDAMEDADVGPGETLYVGDMAYDAEAARAAGVHRFFFSWMFNPQVPVADWFKTLPVVH
jgi:D-glycero-D-manno-heptose 1,7-bisphosphate phosphatase